MTEDRTLSSFLAGETVRGRATDATTDALREAILTGFLAPGTWVREDEVARDLGVSRTPVREAVRRLADEGLVVKTAHQGTQVAAISLEDIIDLYAVREHLEGASARFAAQHRTPDLVEGLTRANDAMRAAQDDPEAMAAHNRDFHRLLYDAAENPYLMRFMREIENFVRRLPTTTYLVDERPTTVVEEHQAIIDAIAAGDQEVAQEAAMAHMRAARNTRVKMALHGL